MELRKDYILDQWTYVAEKRGKRKKEFKEENLFPEVSHCFFCPESYEEELAIGQIGSGKKWKIRWLKNKFPALSIDMQIPVSNDTEFNKTSHPYGFQEVIIDTPKHNIRFGKLPVNHLIDLFNVYQLRLAEGYSDKKIKYVSLFKNFGTKAGASIVHSHTQVIGMGHLPERILKKVKTTKKHDKCPYCEIIKSERKSKRFIMENKHFIAFSTYAPRFSMEFQIVPKKHKLDFCDFNQKELESLAEVVRAIFPKIKSSYNFYFQSSPNRKDDLHFHIEVTPRSSTWAGFELGTERYIVSTAPETAAEYYKPKK